MTQMKARLSKILFPAIGRTSNLISETKGESLAHLFSTGFYGKGSLENFINKRGNSQNLKVNLLNPFGYRKFRTLLTALSLRNQFCEALPYIIQLEHLYSRIKFHYDPLLIRETMSAQYCNDILFNGTKERKSEILDVHKKIFQEKEVVIYGGAPKSKLLSTICNEALIVLPGLMELRSEIPKRAKVLRYINNRLIGNLDNESVEFLIHNSEYIIVKPGQRNIFTSKYDFPKGKIIEVPFRPTYGMCSLNMTIIIALLAKVFGASDLKLVCSSNSLKFDGANERRRDHDPVWDVSYERIKREKPNLNAMFGVHNPVWHQIILHRMYTENVIVPLDKNTKLTLEMTPYEFSRKLQNQNAE
jgi:hypothetical protein